MAGRLAPESAAYLFCLSRAKSWIRPKCLQAAIHKHFPRYDHLSPSVPEDPLLLCSTTFTQEARRMGQHHLFEALHLLLSQHA